MKPAKTVSAATECSYQPRVDDFYFSQLPKEIKGWVRCVGKGFEKQAPNIIFVAQVAHQPNSREVAIGRDRLMAWFAIYEKVIVFGEHKTQVSSYREAGVSQRIVTVNSIRDTGKMSHLLFTAVNPLAKNESFVFIYTDSTESLRKNGSSVSQLRLQFLKPDKLKALAQSVAKQSKS